MSRDTSPTARALRALEVLQSRPGVTAQHLAQRLDVTERAARRYVAILRQAGIPVESTRGPHGGYRLGAGARLAPVLFTQAEALGLVMAVLDAQADVEGLEDHVGVALGKVVRSLPDGVRGQAMALREHAAAAPRRGPSPPDPAVMSALVDAVAARRTVHVTYRSGSGAHWTAEVDPWAVVVRHGRWYLLCHSHRRAAVRTYRADRIRGVGPQGPRFTPPELPDPVAALEEHLGTGWDFETRVVFDAPADDVAPWLGAAMGRLEESGAGCVLLGSTNNPQMYAQEWLAGIPFGFRVEGGPELRTAMQALVARLAASLDPSS